eukprot:333941-Alexandrium_andersonii.AAC.1
MAQRPEASYGAAGQESHVWLRYQVRDGKGYLGCSLCVAWAAAGNRLRGRQALGRFQLREDNPNNRAADTASGHVSRAGGDHRKALADWLAAQQAVAAPAAGAQRRALREQERPTVPQENTVFF